MKRFFSLFLFLLMLSLASTAFADDTWDCPECGRTGNTGKFCGGCGAAAPAAGSTAVIDPVPGDTVFFGSYEQDNDPGNGPEPIEWIVLDVQDGKALLISRYGLDVEPYHTEDMDITWEECYLRSWLNNDFLAAAFSGAEQSAILLTDVDNSVSQGYDEWNIPGGNDTQDRIFLLSCAEAYQYFSVTDEDIENYGARLAATPYAVQKGDLSDGENETEDGSPAVCWWLRSPGFELYCAAEVQTGGGLGCIGVDATQYVRPALWVDLNADIFN